MDGDVDGREDGPSDDAYGRVTDPERYRVLHDDARALIGELVATYGVERSDGVDLDGRAARYWPGSPAVRLDPAGGGAPITFTFTPFPGVMVVAGHASHHGIPSCGCDACDEDPADEAERLREVIFDVAAGGLSEAWRVRRFGTGWYRGALVSRDGSGESSTEGEAEPDDALPPGDGSIEWAPWPRATH